MNGRAVESMKGVYQSIRLAQVRNPFWPTLAFTKK